MQIKKFQMGGEMPITNTAAQAPSTETNGNDVIMQIAQLFAQGLQSGDCNLLAQGAEAFLMLLQQASAPAPMEAAPEGQPVFKKGGKVVKRVKKSCK